MSRFRTIVTAAGLAVALPAGAALAQAAPPAQITVTGEGVVTAAPDMATVSLGVTSTGDTATAAMDANSAALAAVLERIKAAGVEDRDIQTASLQLNPTWSAYDSAEGQKITGYTATNQIDLRVRDLAQLGAVLDAAIKDGANTLNGITFGVTEPDPLLDEARKTAVANARARAELLTQAAGVGLGRVLSISEGGGMMPPPPMYKMEMAAASPVPIEGGEVNLMASVTLTYEIAQ